MKPLDRSAPPIPDRCMVAGCDHPTHIAIAIVAGDGGHERSCLFSEMRFAERFVEWITRCSAHYLRELYGKGRGQFSPKPGDDRFEPARLRLCEIAAANMQAAVKPLADYHRERNEDRRTTA